MHWKAKALAFNVFNTVPFGTYFHYASQKFLTRSLPRTDAEILGVVSHVQKHIDIFKEFYVDFPNAILLEFGAGWDLVNNLVMYCYGINRQIVFDRTTLARQELINSAIKKVKRIKLVRCVRLPTYYVSKNFRDDLKKFYGIEYTAPADAAATDFASESVDLVVTTSTLEHIPQEEIKEIFKELHRIMHKKSVISMNISYNDHYSHSDNTITPYNHLQYSKKQWRKYNPDIHFQNRLRHSDFRDMLVNAGFVVVSESSIVPERAEAMLKSINLADEFKGYKKDDIIKIYENISVMKEVS